jgi:tetratricopeptide (TPR) repeat protein
MYHTAKQPRWAQRVVDRPPAVAPTAAAEQALNRVRQILTAHQAGIAVDLAQLQKALAIPLPTPAQALERLFALGFLHWLTGNLASADAVLEEAVGRATEDKATAQLGESAYWRARVRLQMGRADALSKYEAVLRTLGGSPQATAWFVDLLWRAGRVDRAEQVWKSVKTNKRVLACDEGALCEARASLRRGELPAAERMLTDSTPSNGVVNVERLLFSAWIAAAQKQVDKALNSLRQAEQGPYPANALAEWRRAVEKRARAETPALDSARQVPFLLADLLRGHAEHMAGRNEQAAASYQAASANPFAQPFARYGLACLKQDDFSAVLASQPGLFLALRCRARLAMERFRQRQITAGEYLDVLQQARHAGFEDATATHFQQVAQIVLIKQPAKELLLSIPDGATAAESVERRNMFRAALEQAMTRLPTGDAKALLQEWSQLEWVAADPELSRLVGRQLLRLLLLDRGEVDPGLLMSMEKLLSGDPVQRAGRALLAGPSLSDDAATDAGNAQAPAAVQLMRSAEWLARLAETADSAALEGWRERVRGLRSQSRLRGLAQVLLVQEAAQRGDANAVAALLDEADPWRSFRSGPPSFVLASIHHVVVTHPGFAAWRRCLPRWLQLWDAGALGEPGAALARFVGLAASKASSTDAPPGVPVAPWYLHRATRLLGSDDTEALVCVRRALAQEPDLFERPDGAVVREALPDLERRARAQAIAHVLQPDGHAAWQAAALVDFADLLKSFPAGQEILQAAQGGNPAAARDGVAALAKRSDLPARMVHHLAIIELRTAEALEDCGDPDAAEPCWRRTWHYWLRHFAVNKDDIRRDHLFDHLLAINRKHTNALLAREAVDAARRHWNLVQELPGLAGGLDEDMAKDLAERVVQFKDNLATEYLVTTREAMRYGEVPEGWNADYEKGLSYLRRLLSLDRENLRLLTALVEICGEWFLNLYHTNAFRELAEQVERFTPFALQLLRLVEDRKAEVTARAVLSDFYKFRGFVQRDKEQKLALYREALRLNAGNNNVRDLLAEIEGVSRPATHATEESPAPAKEQPGDTSAR